MKLLERTMGTPESKIRESFDGPFGKPTVDTVFLGNVGYQRLRYPIGIRFFFRNGVVAAAQLCCSDCLCKDDPLAALR